MVKVENLGMNLLYFQNSKTWDYGTYKILTSDLENYQAKKADGTYDESILERILYSHSNKALNQIKKDIDTKGILNVFTWTDLAGSRFIEALPLVMEAQLSGMITDGNKEIKKGSSYTGGGVDASIDASGFLLSHDRIYKAAEDAWFNNQLDKYEIEEGEDEHGNTTYSLIDNAEGTVKKIVATVILNPEQKTEVIDEITRKIGSNSKFDLVNINGKDVIQPKDGRDLLLVDDSGVPIVPSSPNSAASVAIAEKKAQEASKDKASKTLTDVSDADFIAKLKAVGVAVGIFNEFKGVAATAPAGTHNDLDWYINSTDKHIYLWHENKWNNIGGGTTATLDKAAILNLLGITSEQLEVLKRTKELTQIEKDKIASSATLADVANQQDPKIGKKANKFDEHRLMSTIATPDGVHIKRVGGYHSESSFSGGAFFGIVKDDYSVIASFKFINDVANIRFRDAGGAMQDITLQKIYEIAQLKNKFDNLPDDTNAELGKKANAGVSYSKAETDAKYEPLTTFFTPTITSSQSGFLFADETGIKDLAIGTQVRLDLKGFDNIITNPVQVPSANDKLFIGPAGAVRIPNSVGTASLKWETKTNSWDINIKDNYKTKYFVLKKVSKTEYDYVRLEDKPTKPHWETIDMTTYNFTKPEKLRITTNDGSNNIYINICFVGMENNDALINVLATVSDFGTIVVPSWYTWRSDKTNKDKMDLLTYMNNRYGTQPDFLTITKAEIWKEA